MPPPSWRPRSLEAWEDVIGSTVAVSRRRPAAVTIAGVLLIVAGGFAALAGLLIVLTGDGATIEGFGAGEPTLAMVLALVLAVLEIVSGLLVLRVTPAGRTLGMVVAGIGIVGGLIAIASPQGVVTVAIFGFVVFALVTNPDAFRRTHDG